MTAEFTDTHIPNKHSMKLDVQSLLQTLAVLLTIIGYAFKQNDRLTTVEVKQQAAESIIHDINTTQQAMVKLFNEHLISIAGGGEVKSFKDLEDRLHVLERSAWRINK